MEKSILRAWDDLPAGLQNDLVKEYYSVLNRKRLSLIIKRALDLVLGLGALIILCPVWLIISVIIKLDSDGPVIFRQVRVTQYGRHFNMYKFRSMFDDSHNQSITTRNDRRITRVGFWLRQYRLDEIPQLINIITGDMTFVGTRPEVPQYVEKYTDEMNATLLLRAGVTSETSILFKDEENLLENVEDAEQIYLNAILPAKMKYNLESIRHFSILSDLKILIRTVKAVLVRSVDNVGEGAHQAELASTLENSQPGNTD